MKSIKVILPGNRKIKKNQLIVSSKDEINVTRHLLTKLVRKILYENKITYQQFENKVKEFCEENNINKSSLIVSKKNNLLKLVTDPNKSITWQSLEALLYIIFDSGVINIKISCFNKRTEEVIEYECDI